MFRKVPPALSVPAFYAFMTVSWLARALVGRLLGILVLVVAVAYWLLPTLTGIHPLTLVQVAQWVMGQPLPVKTALLTSFVTIVGFMMAYASAMANTRAHLRAALRLQAASDIESVYQQCRGLIIECQVYVNGVITTLQQFNLVDDHSKLENQCRWWGSQTRRFFEAREQLVRLNSEVYRLPGKYGTLLGTVPALGRYLENAAKAYQSICERVWIQAPEVAPGDPSPQSTFIKLSDIDGAVKLRDAIYENLPEINWLAGGIHGGLVAPVVGVNFWSIFHLYRDAGRFTAAIRDRYRRANR